MFGQPVEFLELPGWRILYDRAATIDAFAQVRAGSANECTCGFCENWARTRKRIVPIAMQAILDRLGIPLDRESEVYHITREESGLHLYEGWYHFVGSILSGAKEAAPDVVFETFSMFFASSSALLPPSFLGLSIVQLEFRASAPWLAELPECE